MSSSIKPSVTQRLDETCRALFPENEPGTAALVLKGHEIIFDRGYGLADLNAQTPVTGDTFFNIASCSKQFTAIAVMQLAEQGRLSLDDSVKSHFPEFENDLWNRVTIAHLLSHSSGVPDGRGYLSHERLLACDDNLSVEFMRTLDRLNFESGTAYEYMNPTFTLCGHLIERVSGEPFEDYMRNHIFLPAGMRETLYFDPAHEDKIPRRAHGYEQSDDGKSWGICEYGQETCFATRPDGGIYTSVHEFVRWEEALRNDILLSREGRLAAHTPRTLVSGSAFSDYQNRENTWYGFGWFIEPASDHAPLVIYHTGDNGGFKALTARYPDSETMIAIFSTRSGWDRYVLKTRFEQILGLRR